VRVSPGRKLHPHCILEVSLDPFELIERGQSVSESEFAKEKMKKPGSFLHSQIEACLWLRDYVPRNQQKGSKSRGEKLGQTDAMSGEFLRGFKAAKVVRLQNRIPLSRFGYDSAILHDFGNLNGLSDHHVIAIAIAIAETTHKRQGRWYDR